jgi:hypothetical protein
MVAVLRGRPRNQLGYVLQDFFLNFIQSKEDTEILFDSIGTEGFKLCEVRRLCINLWLFGRPCSGLSLQFVNVQPATRKYRESQLVVAERAFSNAEKAERRLVPSVLRK